MTDPRLNLVVLRVADIDRSVTYYQLLGLTFTRHSHGNGPEHYSSESAGFVFELYPATTSLPVTAATRIGFAVVDVDQVALKLGSFVGAKLLSAPHDSEWGRRAVVADPDGHRIELTSTAGGSLQNHVNQGVTDRQRDRPPIPLAIPIDNDH